jgi:hypothetical protein
MAKRELGQKEAPRSPPVERKPPYLQSFPCVTVDKFWASASGSVSGMLHARRYYFNNPLIISQLEETYVLAFLTAIQEILHGNRNAQVLINIA